MELLTIEETAAILGHTESTVYRYMEDPVDPLPYLQLDGGRVVDRAALQAWLDRQRGLARGRPTDER